MIDIKLFRENPDVIRASQKKRGLETKQIDEVIKLDASWRKKLQEADKLKHKRNVVTEKIAESKKKGKDVKKDIKEMKKVANEISELDSELKELENKRDKLRMNIPNMLHETVPVGKDDSANVPINFWGEKPRFNFTLKGHEEIAEKLGLLDMERAAKISGARFYYLLGDLVILDMALQRFAIDHMVKKGFIPVEPPSMMRRKPYEGVIALGDFQDVMYKIENEDLYMIATSEHPLVARFMDETLNEHELPTKFVGISSCFRKEAGAHGKDTKGIFRTHQFNKVEQIIFCKPEESWAWHDKLQRNSEEIYEQLGLHYRVVNICTGDLGSIAAKKYDIELWMPTQGKYREVGSCSNTLDYQANRLNIKFVDKDNVKKAVHILNNTVIATGRVMVAILENFQREDGTVAIPKVLWPYTGFKELMSKK